ncbi:MAG: PqqD family peptide modification chaperone, partial [Gammaproteobacteria bacterium]|nr:PqqD family peptide modification chaperone [Gammaproteobacteria bacterium]
MGKSLFSPYWYRVSQLKPQVRNQARIHRHYYGGEQWYVLQDQVTGKHYRFTPVAYQIIGLMDGVLTVQTLWEKASERFGDDAPTQDDIVRMLGQLHAANILLCNVPPDTAQLFRRHKKQVSSTWKQRLSSPTFMRIPLLDPDKFLSQTAGLVRPFFSIFGVILWLAVVGTALVLACTHWTALTENMTDRVFSTQNMLLLGLCYPVIKVIHEFGHAYAVKVRGGEVHEMGIMLMVFAPVPYVDASASLAFADKRKRVSVGMAGMVVELFVAALVFFLWLNIEHGVVHAIAYNIILIASVSTVLVNINPLLKYDGYYILSDVLEISNFSQRSTQYLGHLSKRYLLGLKNDESPHIGPGERYWLFVYSIASFAFRIFIYTFIILLVANKFFFIGIILAIWAFASMIAIPVFKRIHFVLCSPSLREIRSRAVFIPGMIITTITILLCFMPFPSWTRSEGVTWAPEESLVRVNTDCFVKTINTKNNVHVQEGDILIECEDPLLSSRVKILRTKLRALKARYNKEIHSDRVKAKITKAEMSTALTNIEMEEEKLDELIITSPTDGVFVLPNEVDMPGRFLKKGTLVAYVLEMHKPLIVAVVSQSDVDTVRQNSIGTEVRFVEHLERTCSATIKQETPEALE